MLVCLLVLIRSFFFVIFNWFDFSLYSYFNLFCSLSFPIILQQKLAKREAGIIDRSQDIARLQEFYRHFREKNSVDKLREEEMRLRESGIFTGEYVSATGVK